MAPKNAAGGPGKRKLDDVEVSSGDEPSKRQKTAAVSEETTKKPATLRQSARTFRKQNAAYLKELIRTDFRLWDELCINWAQKRLESEYIGDVHYVGAYKSHTPY